MTTAAPEVEETTTAPDAPVNGEHQQAIDAPAPAPEPKADDRPFDVVRGVEKYLADAIENAESDEETVTAKVMEQRSAVARLNIALLRVKEAEKSIKGRLETAVEMLDELEHESTRAAEQKRDQPELPFGEKPADESWKQVRLDSLEPQLKPAKLACLEEHEPRIITLGDLTDFQKTAGEWWWKNIKGLGQGGLEQIATATDKYWADHGQDKPNGGAAVNLDLKDGGVKDCVVSTDDPNLGRALKESAAKTKG